MNHFDSFLSLCRHCYVNQSSIVAALIFVSLLLLLMLLTQTLHEIMFLKTEIPLRLLFVEMEENRRESWSGEPVSVCASLHVPSLKSVCFVGN